MDEEDEILRAVDKDNRENMAFVEEWGDRMMETYQRLKQNPEVYTVEQLAKDYWVMRQRVHAILWLKEMDEEEEKKLGRPLDDSVEILLITFQSTLVGKPKSIICERSDSKTESESDFQVKPRVNMGKDSCECGMIYGTFFNSHDREFHVASLPYKPDFKVMPEGWDGTTRDPDEVAGEVKCHKYSRRRPSEGWSFTVEKLGPHGKRGGGGGWKFVSLPDGSGHGKNVMEVGLQCLDKLMEACMASKDVLDLIEVA
ncbi:hypothetical protein COCNU_11G006490 [Cocos nucifera]|uniref:Uncharacterized protein n=1 Tax=Cocos nucifera TaxID=13894 RepID=A0A8K0IP42_COCNU|nr:hypothetical protein COCNU_11G006490 [Cocos nucifera]